VFLVGVAQGQPSGRVEPGEQIQLVASGIQRQRLFGRAQVTPVGVLALAAEIVHDPDRRSGFGIDEPGIDEHRVVVLTLAETPPRPEIAGLADSHALGLDPHLGRPGQDEPETLQLVDFRPVEPGDLTGRGDREREEHDAKYESQPGLLTRPHITPCEESGPVARHGQGRSPLEPPVTPYQRKNEPPGFPIRCETPESPEPLGVLPVLQRLPETSR